MSDECLSPRESCSPGLCWNAVEDTIPESCKEADRELIVSTAMSTIMKYIGGPVFEELTEKMNSPKELWNAIADLFGGSSGQGKCKALVNLLQIKSIGPPDKNEYLTAFDKARLNAIGTVLH